MVMSAFFTVVLEPILTALGLYECPDPTYGRRSLPVSEAELELQRDPSLEVTQGRAFIREDKERVELKEVGHDKPGSFAGEGVKAGKRWIAYQTLRDPMAEERESLNADVYMIHGINDYGGKLVVHAEPFLKAGFRVVIVDLPSHGRSTGLHVYLPNLKILADALHAVILDIHREDMAKGFRERKGRKVYLFGGSLGGFVAMYYAALYPPPPPAEDDDYVDEDTRPRLSGVVGSAPMLGIAPESYPSKLVEFAGRVLSWALPRLAFVSGVRGNIHQDPRVEQEFLADPRTYHGHVRIATALAIVNGLEHLQQLASKITVPIFIVHGLADRATSPAASKDFIENRVSTPKEDRKIKMYPGYEHVMLAKYDGMPAEEEKKRMAVLEDVRDWLLDQARKQTSP